jgi:dihydroorotate dehydrogenase electron transfer subunit
MDKQEPALAKTSLRTMKQFIAKILSHAPVSDCFFELAFAWDAAAGPVLPGQFCTIRVSPYSAPLLRRPFAFSRYDEKAGVAAIAYKKRGPATELLSCKPSGETIDVIGPLGNDFFRFATAGYTHVYLVAGGTGFGPIAFLANHCAQRNLACTVILGCRTRSQLPRLNIVPSVKAVVCTDDGTEGIHGTPLTYLAALSPPQYTSSAVFSCGPAPLLAGCHEWALARGLSCFVSMEQVMACGVGACMGCAVRVTDAGANGFARACTEGPVFDSRRILWT